MLPLVFCAAWLALFVLRAALVSRGMGYDEALWLRFMLACTLHPVRSSLAVALGFLALSRLLSGLRAMPGLGQSGSLVIIRRAAPASARDRAPRAPTRESSAFTRPASQASIMSTTLRDNIITGPKEIAGLGATLTINPCQESFRSGVLLSQAVIVTKAASTIRELSRDGKKVNTVLVAGEIDPLEHEDFRAISENLKDICKKWFPKAKLHLIAYPRFINSPGRSVALDYYHQVTMRLEAGTQKTFAAMTGEKGEVFKRVVDTLTRLDIGHLVVRARFVRGGIDNSTVSEVRGWIKCLAQIKPMRVEIKSPKKGVFAKTKPITATRMKEILAEVEEKTGLNVVQIEQK